MFYVFQFLCIDVTEVNCLCKFVNDSEQKYPNCSMRKSEFGGQPRIDLIATTNIVDGEELRYDYGDVGLPWRLKIRLKQISPLIEMISLKLLDMKGINSRSYAIQQIRKT